MGGLLEMILERCKHPPALLFEDIPNTRQEMTILCSQIDTIECKGFNLRAIIDATRPYEWRDQFPAVNAVSDEFKNELDKKYASLLKEVLQRAH